MRLHVRYGELLDQHNDGGPALNATHSQKTLEYMIDHQYLNILAKPIIDDETGE